MDKQVSQKTIFSVLSAGLLVIIAGRWLPHPPNFTPMIGALIFSAVFFKKQYFHFILPIVGLWLSDLFLNNVIYPQYFEGFTLFSEPFLWSAASFFVIAILVAKLAHYAKGWGLVALTILSTIIFFVLSNLGAWLASPMLYTRDLAGLMTSYAAGLPFLFNSVMGDLFYTIGFFALYALVDRVSVQKKLAF